MNTSFWNTVGLKMFVFKWKEFGTAQTDESVTRVASNENAGLVCVPVTDTSVSSKSECRDLYNMVQLVKTAKLSCVHNWITSLLSDWPRQCHFSIMGHHRD